MQHAKGGEEESAPVLVQRVVRQLVDAGDGKVMKVSGEGGVCALLVLLGVLVGYELSDGGLPLAGAATVGDRARKGTS